MAGPAGIGGGAGGSSTADSNTALTALLKAAGTKWSAATVGAGTAEPLELSSGTAIMALGGFNGGDNSISLADFEKLVQAGEIHYFIGGGNGGGPGWRRQQRQLGDQQLGRGALHVDDRRRHHGL